jgi:hypothetical protein
MFMLRTGEQRVEQRLIDWGGVWAGLIWTIGIMVLLSSLWLALGFTGNGVEAIANDIEWWLAGTAIFALFVGGIIAGWAPRARGGSAGVVNGMTVWGTLLTLSLVIGVPSILGGAAIVGNTLTDPAQVDAGVEAATTGITLDQDASLWATFLVALIGFVTATLGGVIGGMLPKRDQTVEVYDDRDHLAYPMDRDPRIAEGDRFQERRVTDERAVPAHIHRGNEVIVVEDDDRGEHVASTEAAEDDLFRHERTEPVERRYAVDDDRESSHRR